MKVTFRLVRDVRHLTVKRCECGDEYLGHAERCEPCRKARERHVKKLNDAGLKVNA